MGSCYHLCWRQGVGPGHCKKRLTGTMLSPPGPEPNKGFLTNSQIAGNGVTKGTCIKQTAHSKWPPERFQQVFHWNITAQIFVTKPWFMMLTCFWALGLLLRPQLWLLLLAAALPEWAQYPVQLNSDSFLFSPKSSVPPEPYHVARTLEGDIIDLVVDT